MSDGIELKLQEFHVTMGSMQSGLQDHQNLLNQLKCSGASQRELLDILRGELNRVVRPIPIPEDQRSLGPLPEQTSVQESNSGTAFGTNAYWPTTVALRFSESRRKDCKCSCHRQTHVRSPSFLDHLFGSFFIGYIGIPGFSTKCTFKRPCCQGAETNGSIAYVFPFWLVALVIMAKVEHSQRNGPQMLLRCYRVRPIQSVPFQAALQSQWGQLDMLVRTGKASPRDISEQGYSFLHVSRSTRLHQCFPF